MVMVRLRCGVVRNTFTNMKKIVSLGIIYVMASVALEIMEISYAKLNQPGLAEDSRAILQASYPNYLLHRDEFYRQQAGEAPDYELPAMDSSPASGAPIDDSNDTATGQADTADAG